MKNYRHCNRVNTSELIGQTFIAVHKAENLEDELRFIKEDGSGYAMCHLWDCCESVDLIDTCGDLPDLVGSPILVAEAVVSEDWPEGVEKDEYIESYTWTFYKLATIKGSVTLRWLGHSNGYYSESVDIIKVDSFNGEQK